MNIIELFQKELENEAQTTRKMLSRVPVEKASWKPHAKNMTMEQLAGHVAELPGWVKMAVETDGLDFATTPYVPKSFASNNELMEFFEKSLQEGKDALAKASPELLEKIWTLRNGETILSESSKADVIRMSMSQIIHHRAQLGMYLRLLDIPIPGSYGPSADEH